MKNLDEKDKDMTIFIKAEERYSDCLNDSFCKCNTIKREYRKVPKNYVDIYEIKDNKRKLLTRNNLIVSAGREWAASRILNMQNINITSTPNEFLCWFGVGSGGCLLEDPLNPISPTNADTDLKNKVVMHESNFSYGDYVSGEGYYKKQFDNIEYIQDQYNDNAQLICLVTNSLTQDDANDNIINEAALYTGISSLSGYGGPFTLYAKITFQTIIKKPNMNLIFAWYLFF